MALNPIPIGDQIAEYLYQNTLAQPGTPVSLDNLKIIWENIMTRIYDDIKASADIDATAHSGEDLSSATGQTVIIPSTANPGSQSNGTTSQDKKLVGKGRIL